MRRILVMAALGASLLAIALVGVLALRDDDVAKVVSTSTTTTSGPAPVPGPREPGTTTTVKGAPVQSGGSAPVAGAILTVPVDDPGEPVDVGEETDCEAVDGELRAVACVRVDGSGGEALVYVGRDDDGGLLARLYRGTEAGGDEFQLVRRSPVFRPGGDVVGISLSDAEVAGEAVAVVDYDFDGSGAVHSFDVVAWDATEVDPKVVAFVNGTGSDRVVRSRGTLQFVGANYDDGSPTCCPNFADVRTLTREGAGKWAITKRTVPFSQAP